MFYACSSSALEFSGTAEELRGALDAKASKVMVIGRSKRLAYSNLAHLNLLVTTKESSLSESLQENAKVRESLVEDLIQNGIPADDIKNSKFSSSPHYGIFRGKKPSKYTVENSLRVTARTEQQLLSVNQVIDRTEAAELGQIEFEVENEEQLKKELRTEAMKDATDQAVEYGKALGLKLVPLSFSFQRGRSNYNRQDNMQIEEVIVTAARVGSSRRNYQDAVEPESVSFEQSEYTSSVEVVFESRPAAD
jgi:uncharacterized protein YggE